MTKVSSSIKTEAYRIEISLPSGNIVIADEPIDKGGKDSGFSPKELLGAFGDRCV
jgi:putative redox protein